MQDQFVVFDRMPQLAHQRQPLRTVFIVLRGVNQKTGAIALGRIHGDVGALHQGIGIGAVLRIKSDAHTRAYIELQSFQHERHLQRLFDTLDDLADITRLSEVGNHYGILVATQARDGFGFVRRALQAGRHLLEQAVAIVRSHRLVDLFEAINIHNQDGETRLALRRSQNPLPQPVLEQNTIG